MKKASQLRKVEIIRNFTKYPAGSVLIKWGNTWVLCTASVSDKVPPFLKDSGQGWVTAEYSMLPGCTPERKDRDIKKLKLDARSTEIQRLIGRALRAAVDMKKLGERQITIDCDVLQADGGTRCASITGGMVALTDAVNKLLKEKVIAENPLVQNVAAVSVGVCDGVPTLDLDYIHDSTAEVDLNVIMTDRGKFVELQGCAEHKPFSDKDLAAMIKLAKKGLKKLFALQRSVRKVILLGLLSSVFAAGAADDAAKHNSTEMNAAAYAAGGAAKEGLRVLFIGNSITLHGPCPSIGWTNNWGMAASAAEKDFVHIVTRGVERHFNRKASVMVRNLADFERNYRTWDMTNLNEMVAFDPQVLVVALGENSPELKTDADRKDYYEAYRRLFGKFLDGRRTKPLAAVRGVFWPNAAKDAAMASAAGDYALPFVKADVFGEPGMDAKDAGWKHAGVAAHPGDRGMAEIARRIVETLFPTESGFAAKVNGKSVKVRPIRISAMEFNRFPSELWQRPADQTEVAGMVTVEAKGATKWVVKPSRAFTNAVVRPLAARVKPVVKDGEVSFTLPGNGHYTLELDGFHNPLQMFVEPKRDFSEEKKAATLTFGPGNHYAGEVHLKSHDRVYIDKDAYVYGMFGIEDAEDVQISGYGVICGTVGRRCTSHCYGGMNPTPIWAMRSKKIRVYGPTVVDSACWCVSTFDCRDVEFSHVKVTGMWRYNTDGVDICNSQNVYLHDSFIHSFDDTIVIKGLVEDRTKPVEDIRVERCTCWCGWGGTLETGLETWASSWRNVVFEDCDLIHNSMAALRLHLGGPCKVENTTYRNIRIEYDASESEPEYHRNHDDKYTKRAKRPWNDCWLAILNDKMYGPNSIWKNPDVGPDEPFGSFGTATLEDIDIAVEPGVPAPKHYIGFEKGTKLGEIEWNNVRMNGKPVELQR